MYEICAKGFSKVNLPYALAKKYPKVDKEWRWQFVFPAAQRSRDPRSKEIYRHHVGEWVLQKAKEAVAKCRLSRPASCHTLRHSFAIHSGRLLRHQDRAGTVGP